LRGVINILVLLARKDSVKCQVGHGFPDLNLLVLQNGEVRLNDTIVGVYRRQPATEIHQIRILLLDAWNAPGSSEHGGMIAAIEVTFNSTVVGYDADRLQ
jgi:MOSC domain-containing protein YiiM